jgi:hypothetical protein
VIEALAHGVISDKLEAAYRSGNLFDKGAYDGRLGRLLQRH